MTLRQATAASWPGMGMALLAGGLQALSMAWPGSGLASGWLQVFSLGLLCVQLLRLRDAPGPAHVSVRCAARQGGLFALAWLAGTFWWLHVSMHQVGGLPAPLSVAAVVLLAGLLGLYYAAAAAAWLMLVRRAGWTNRPLVGSVLFAALWLLAELARGVWLTGFPWGAGGYAHIDGWLARLAPWVGVYGIGAVAAGLAMRLAWPARRGRAWLGLLVLGAALHGLPQNDELTQPAGGAEVALLQAGINQSDKFEALTGVRVALDWYAEQLKGSRQPLVIAPETAIPLLPRHLPEGYWQGLQAHFAASQQLALVGIPWGDAASGYANALVALGPPGTPTYRYDKAHLVPFGESIPPGFAWFVRQMQIPLADFTPGSLRQPTLDWQGQRLAPNICYEDLFGEELAQRFADQARAPTVLVNASNIAWFGNTVAVDQHLNISRMRALELGRPMLRATNTGATAIIDHRGQVQAQLPRFTRGSLTGSFEGRTGLTPYARWAAAFGLWPLWGLALLVAGLAFLRRRGI